MSVAKFVIDTSKSLTSTFDIPILIVIPFKLFKGKMAITVKNHNEMVRTTRLEF